MASGKTFGGWLSGPLLAQAEQRVAADYAGNASAYVVELIQNDLAGRLPANTAETALVELAKTFHPTLAAELGQALGGTANQPRILARLLEALVEALKRGGDFKAEEPFHLYNSREQFLAKGGDQFLGALASHLKELAERAPLAAEGAAKYSDAHVADPAPGTGGFPISPVDSPVDAAVAAELARRKRLAAGRPNRRAPKPPGNGPAGSTAKD